MVYWLLIIIEGYERVLHFFHCEPLVVHVIHVRWLAFVVLLFTTNGSLFLLVIHRDWLALQYCYSAHLARSSFIIVHVFGSLTLCVIHIRWLARMFC